ncbi:allantoinase AllB [Shumkonia mesophila]|uniref:allantoinase AllB n=1 Tax=Shumkonia mesophila TaxID=2838854 RepID=UPI002934B340|nr:allantoinase AllB [Shumkonia mesophila]
MKKADLVIRNGIVISPNSAVQADVAIRDGRIVAIGEDDAFPKGLTELDAAGKYLIPGAIDSHVHFRDPGHTDKENWETGSAAAIVGGVTTVLDMPNTVPHTGTVEGLLTKREIASSRSYADFGLYGLLDESSIDHLEALIAAGVPGFKCFMCNTTGSLPSPSDGAMLEGFEIIARHGVRCSVHAENASIVEHRSNRLRAAGRTDALSHLAARPAVCAIEAVGRAITFAEWTGARLHIAHKSSKDALPLIRDAKARGVDITVETCPHYLLMDSRDVERWGGVLRVNPPIREEGHAAALWQALKDGVIDMISTDHAPHTSGGKNDPNIWNCCCGITGVELQMPLMLTEVNRGRMTINDYVRWSAVNPAKAWGLFPRKGILQVGSDADIVVVDMGLSDVIDQTRLHSKQKFTPWHGSTTTGKPIHTILRGQVIVRNGELVMQPGCGREVQPRMPPPAPRNQDKTLEAVTRAPV